MLQGRGRALHGSGQRALAVWALKTAMMAEHTHGATRHAIPPRSTCTCSSTESLRTGCSSGWPRTAATWSRWAACSGSTLTWPPARTPTGAGATSGVRPSPSVQWFFSCLARTSRSCFRASKHGLLAATSCGRMPFVHMGATTMLQRPRPRRVRRRAAPQAAASPRPPRRSSRSVTPEELPGGRVRSGRLDFVCEEVSQHPADAPRERIDVDGVAAVLVRDCCR